MSYELILLRKDWFFTNPSPAKYETLTRVINKAYSKAMANYGIIQSNRIKSPQSFLQCLKLSPQKDCIIIILLGSKEVFEKLKHEYGYVRNFNHEIWPLTNCNDSDLRPGLVKEFGPLVPESVRIHTLAPDEDLDPAILDRCLATVGLKETSPSGDVEITDQKEEASLLALSELSESASLTSDRTLELELTAYTSFMSGCGTSLLEYVISEWLSSAKNDWFTEHNVSSYTLLASVIKEHDLVSYYTKKCGFHESGQPDVIVNASGIHSPFESGIVAASDFTVSFLKREVEVRK